MRQWDLSTPPASDLGDHDVPLESNHLWGKRIALMICGGIAAMKAPFVARGLRRHGADVVAYCSEEALRYTTVDALEWSTTNAVVTRLTASAEHLSKAAPFDAYLVAPATYNTINKFRFGVADGALTTTLASALGLLERGKTRILIAPTMHGDLHNSILTESLKKLQGLGVHFIPPREAYGKHNIPQTEELVAYVCAQLSSSPLRNAPILVTGGPTPVPIDGVRRITNRFKGRLGIEIAKELELRGADVHLILGDAGLEPPPYVDYSTARTYEDYREMVLNALEAKPYSAGIFSAAVADYRPMEVFDGKIASGGALSSIKLKPTGKVIDEVRERYAGLRMISFKYEENVSREQLFQVARSRVENGHSAVVANRAEDSGPKGEQVAYLLAKGEELQTMVGKRSIAIAIADFLERRSIPSRNDIQSQSGNVSVSDAFSA